MLENEFSNNIVRPRFRNIGLNVTPIESHGTNVGIPDLFVQGYGMDSWWELKCIKINKPWAKIKSITIPYRPGQLAWASDYTRCHSRKKYTHTLIHLECSDMCKVIHVIMTAEAIDLLLKSKHKISLDDKHVTFDDSSNLIRLCLNVLTPPKIEVQYESSI